jgi:hypothetical protein
MHSIILSVTAWQLAVGNWQLATAKNNGITTKSNDVVTSDFRRSSLFPAVHRCF